MVPEDGRKRVQIEGIWPEFDGGRFAIKRTIGDRVHVEVDMFTDGHDVVSGVVLYRPETSETWLEVPLFPLVNDRWQGEFTVSELGSYVYTVMGWVDHFKTWRNAMDKKLAADQDVSVELLIGAELIEHASDRATGDDAAQLKTWAETLRSNHSDSLLLGNKALSEDLAHLMAKYPDRKFATTYDKELKVTVDREKARFSTWYELFPRSCGEAGEHGTFNDVVKRLPYIANLGFDVLYLPPIHPIGTTFRKGKNNSTTPEPEDVGVPWGIGSPEGGHKAIHPQLGTMDDFKNLVAKAAESGIEIALDLAYQCSPDHPYVKEHPQWFKHRPDGTIQYAENPPKKYQDIYPIDFETEDWENLWNELKSVVLFWIDKGVKIFRVDNPHTKAFLFWEWMIGDVKKTYPDVMFLAEAFTRPKMMYRLAKLGFTQSYTYFTWRNNKWELTEYFKELTSNPANQIFRPNVWPNTPDILHEYLQHGGQPAFKIRLVLAATLAATYGMYGPAFEVCENRPLKPGSEEYLDSEKYQLRYWDLDSPFSIKHLIGRINSIRREHRALQDNNSLRFHHTDNEQIICYSKQTENLSDVILTIVNLNPYWTQGGWIDLPLESLGIDPYRDYQVHDLLSDRTFTWFGGHNYVELHPHGIPAHVFRIKQ
ncbi:MAG TPA: alpha-1,4-glucan--maltose-1-phosphate maltosyltransferase [Cyanobacteria bacterium UBA12227]|nr:alpha-1,4-glucan--maltose-1-phosphate maltosyltransferase [Cyanobacteria bacterium UBA12227]HAX86856.1 alpha-1,4-glucan--maltose-1-phosphate maltosyltransferase [Cyanobacteria bacterium UBA11370]HBY81051.1 alpha-1,4-glucan--maltose-1-phosphate maltosyltransferase [Cyanobacteria bacterium UBA11148]